MHHWKQKRTKVGSQCSWISLQIESLDKKISCLHKIHRKLKSERQISRIVNFEPTLKNDEELSTNKNVVLPLIINSEEQFSTHGSSRTCSISATWSHNYIRKLPVVQSNTAKCYGCRNLPSVYSCRFCARQPYKKSYQNYYSQNMTAELDASYHSNLSYDNGKLSSLLEIRVKRKPESMLKNHSSTELIFSYFQHCKCLSFINYDFSV